MAFADTSDINFVIDNLCLKTKSEMLKLFGSDYKNKVLEQIKNSCIYSIKLKSNDKTAGLFGIIKVNDFAGGIFLLTTAYIQDGNIITFLRQAKLQVENWTKEYSLVMDNCDNSNFTIQKWLKILGFQPSEYKNDNFTIWYKGDLKYYD